MLGGLFALTACSKPLPAKAPPPSVLLVTVDTLRADRVGAYGDSQARTPRMDGLARAGVSFDAAFTVAPITLPAHATILTGRLPPAHGVRGNGGFVLAPEVQTLGQALRARGLRTGAFVGGFPLARRFGLDHGFDHYDDAMGKASGVHYEFAERRADIVSGAARAWLRAEGGPVFLWVHFFDPHAPYDPPPAFRAEDPYRGEIAAVDAALQDLLEDWDARRGPSVVALTADHGEAFGEHGEESHSLFVYDTTLRVPLILRADGLAAGRRVPTPVSLVDLAATLLARVPGAGPDLPGRDLLAASPAPAAPVYAETMAPRLEFGWSDLRALREGRYKLIRAPRPELYDVADDPAEAHDLAAREPARVRGLQATLDRILGETGDGQSARAPSLRSGGAPDREAAERLRSLGYVQGPGGRGSGADPKDRVEVALAIARAAGPFPDLAAAIRAYRSLAARDPENPLVNLRLADALLRAGRAADAVPYFERVVAGEPRTADAHVGLATAFAQQGRLDAAQRILEHALAVEPGNGQIHYNLGEIARVRGDRVRARREYEAALGDPTTASRAREKLDTLP